MAKIEQIDPKLPKAPVVQRGLKKRDSVKQRSVVKRYSSMNEVVIGLAKEPKQNDDFEQVLDDIEGRDKEVFKSFVTAFMQEWGISDPKVEEKILKDDDLKEAVLVFLTLDSLYSPKIKAVKKKLAKRIVERMTSYFPKMKKVDEKEMFRFFFNYLFVKHIEMFRDRILNTGNEKAIKIWHDGLESLRKDGADGKIKTSKQFVDRLTEIFKNAIEATGDEKLQAMWRTYEESTIKEVVDFALSVSEESVVKEKKKEKPVTKKEEKRKAVKKVAESVNGVAGYEMAQDSTGNAKVIIGGELEVEMSIYMNENNEFLYSIHDEYISEPVKVKASGLLQALYSRQLDGMTTKQLLKHADFVTQVASIKDKELIGLIKKLVGEGKDKNYRLSEEDRSVVKGLVKILRGKDVKYLSLEKKIRFLKEALNTKQKGDYARRQILDNLDSIESVSALIEILRK